MWRIGESQDLVASMKEHTAAVTGLKLTRGDAECASAGADGVCIVWDLRTFARRTSLTSQVLSAVVYHPDESQLVTTGAPAVQSDDIPRACRAHHRCACVGSVRLPGPVLLTTGVASLRVFKSQPVPSAMSAALRRSLLRCQSWLDWENYSCPCKAVGVVHVSTGSWLARAAFELHIAAAG